MKRTPLVAVVLLTVALLAAALVGCHGPAPSTTPPPPTSPPQSTWEGQSTSPPAPAPSSTTPRHTRPAPGPSDPASPPKTPTDTLPTRTFAGALTADSGGPCYTIRTDDGVEVHVYGPLGPLLHKGDVVRVTTTPGTPGRSCGPGTTSIATSVTKVG